VAAANGERLDGAGRGPRSRVVVAISGASGALYGVRMLETLAARGDVETHLVVSRAGAVTLQSETDYSVRDLATIADVVHRAGNPGASIASGSFRTAGMVVAPCSIKTLSAIANCYAADLIARAADVMLKEGRPLVLMVRETPLHLGHIRLMETVALAGGVIAPPVPAFYHPVQTIDDLVMHSVRRVIDRLGLPNSGAAEWRGINAGALPMERAE
jgi:4-hydroxy-3-polyprenylbenzoate decarboxylase